MSKVGRQKCTKIIRGMWRETTRNFLTWPPKKSPWAWIRVGFDVSFVVHFKKLFSTLSSRDLLESIETGIKISKFETEPIFVSAIVDAVDPLFQSSYLLRECHPLFGKRLTVESSILVETWVLELDDACKEEKIRERIEQSIIIVVKQKVFSLVVPLNEQLCKLINDGVVNILHKLLFCNSFQDIWTFYAWVACLKNCNISG